MKAVLKQLLGAALLFAAAMPAALAQAYPQKAVRIVIGFSAGGTTDLVGRAVAQQLSEAWGQPVIVENKPGASGMTAADLVAKAAPDGYTLLVTPQTRVAVAPALYGKAPYDTLRDFQPITLMGSTPPIMVVNPSFEAKTFAQFADLARRSNPPLNYGSGGIGSSPHMAGELLGAQLGIKQNHIPSTRARTRP